jgi:methylated-DNA-protein-cysteine methyltransferase related protein
MNNHLISFSLQYNGFGKPLNTSLHTFKWGNPKMHLFTEKAIEIMKNIPAGKIMTYGQIARLAGSPRGARQVVRILHSMSKKYHLPWHRVINSKGEIVLRNTEQSAIQKLLLQSEGVELIDERYINLGQFQFHPDL